MSGKLPDTPPRRLIEIVTAIVVMAAVVVLVGKYFEGSSGKLEYPEPIDVGAGGRPIASEANVFRISHDELGVFPAFERDTSAHVRSLDMYRRLRAYPGAPPRVPHGLTDEEFRNSSCNICHLRGGWVARFNTYAPVTPHPEFSSCLQCHVAQDTLVGRPLPIAGDAVTCRQCHIDPDADPAIFVDIDWRTVPWPETNMQAMPQSPQWIPHDFQTRSNCLACHSGPGAVVDLRTDHPERANCRQCHVQASEAATTFLGPSDGSGRRSEGTP
jgi:cytochrome c-type protein NapB